MLLAKVYLKPFEFFSKFLTFLTLLLPRFRLVTNANACVHTSVDSKLPRLNLCELLRLLNQHQRGYSILMFVKLMRFKGNRRRVVVVNIPQTVHHLDHFHQLVNYLFTASWLPFTLVLTRSISKTNVFCYHL